MVKFNEGYTIVNEDADMYSIINAGEVCSIATAKKWNFFDRDKYFSQQSNEIKTFSDNVNNDNAKKYQLCTQTEDKTKAQPLCGLISPGMIPKGNGKCGYPNEQCPPGFKWNPTTKRCNKPIHKIMHNRKEHCSSKWHDWFTVANANLGNKYEMVKNKCYKPCQDSKVPINGTDPVTGENRGTSDLKKCVDTIEYLGGKYANEPDFCNLGWIKRLTVNTNTQSKLPNIEDEVSDKYPKFVKNSSRTVDEAVRDGVKEIINASFDLPQNLRPHSDMTERICSRNVDNPERLQEAYNICKRLDKNQKPENQYTEEQYIADMKKTLKYANRSMNTETKSVTDDIKNRFRLLNQACHYTFCDKTGSRRAAKINEAPVCLTPAQIERVALKKRSNIAVDLTARPGMYPQQTTERSAYAHNTQIVKSKIRTFINTFMGIALTACYITGIYFIAMGIYMIIIGDEFYETVDITIGKIRNNIVQNKTKAIDVYRQIKAVLENKKKEVD